MKVSDLASLAANLPESQKMRIYLVSMLGLHNAQSDDPTKQLAIFYHSPSLIEAQSLNIAVDIAKQRIEKLWPKSEGWTLRSVAVEPWQPSEIQLLLQYWQAGMISTQESDEQGVTVDLDATDSQSTVIGHFDTPAS